MKIHKLSPEDNQYTQPLENIIDPPKNIFYRGKLPEKRVKSVAIVGARKPTSYGKEIAFSLAKKLAEHDVVIVSGMALGIDGLAHKGALAGGGTTIAVLANGVDKFYPRSHSGLGRQILEQGGAILSEYEPGVPALPHQFLARNRFVSGLADVVVVVEAALRSGTLSTASHALDQGKDVLAVPGNITSPLSEGCNRLIKTGAQPLTNVRDVLDLLFPNFSSQIPAQKIPKSKDPIENMILEIISKGVTSGDQILKISQLEVPQFNQAISMLEINDQIISLGANCWAIKN